ncbi:MAG TPA: HAD family phosphatase [Polyangiaceae bacterium]|nr:HAD family phosphatase [Polyangiaceae bacterium]
MANVVLHLPTQRYDAFIFDCDGTLVDSMPLHFRAWRKALAQSGAPFDFTWELFQSRAGMGLPQTVVALNEQFRASLDPATVVREQQGIYDALLDELQPIAPVEEFARKVALSAQVSVASGGGRGHVTRSLLVTGLAPLFQVVVTQDDVTRGKPDPEMFLLAAERMGVSARRCLVLEDSPLGLQAARAAGMGTAWVEHLPA